MDQAAEPVPPFYSKARIIKAVRASGISDVEINGVGPIGL